MVLVRATGQPGELRVRFAASQRELLEGELELWRSSSTDSLKMVRKRSDTNPAFITFKEADLDATLALISQLTAVPEGEDFTLTGDSNVLYGCVQGAAGVASEHLMTRVDELPPGPHHEDEAEDLQAHLAIMSLWVGTLVSVQPFEPSRARPEQLLPVEASRE